MWSRMEPNKREQSRTSRAEPSPEPASGAEPSRATPEQSGAHAVDVHPPRPDLLTCWWVVKRAACNPLLERSHLSQDPLPHLLMHAPCRSTYESPEPANSCEQPPDESWKYRRPSTAYLTRGRLLCSSRQVNRHGHRNSRKCRRWCRSCCGLCCSC
jgi:hypothetical protein